MILQTERLLIRPVAADDWTAAKWIWEDEKRSEYARYDNPKDTEDAAVQVRIARWARFADSLEHMFFAVCLGKTVIGYIALNRKETEYEIGYCFHSDYHRKGYAAESISALLKELNRRNAVTCVFARAAMENVPSRKLLERLGFRLTGREQVTFYRDEEGKNIYFEGHFCLERIKTPCSRRKPNGHRPDAGSFSFR